MANKPIQLKPVALLPAVVMAVITNISKIVALINILIHLQNEYGKFTVSAASAPVGKELLVLELPIIEVYFNFSTDVAGQHIDLGYIHI